MQRFGAVSGVILGLSIGVPGLIEAFTGETAGTSFVIGLGAAAFGAPAVTGIYLRQAAAAGRFGAIAYAVNLVGLGLFAAVAFALNLVLYFLDEAVVKDLLAGPTRIAFLLAAVTFVIGTLMFGVSMLRARVYGRILAIGYALSLTALALLAPLPDTPVTSGIHVLVCVALVGLSISLWRSVRT